MAAAIDLNTATKEQLDSIEELSGHGHEIVRYREERGGFSSLRELDEVPGLTGKFGEETRKRLFVAARDGGG
jgi:DNA uptake protein ComE-like DNA-binding protein